MCRKNPITLTTTHKKTKETHESEEFPSRHSLNRLMGDLAYGTKRWLRVQHTSNCGTHCSIRKSTITVSKLRAKTPKSALRGGSHGGESARGFNDLLRQGTWTGLISRPNDEDVTCEMCGATCFRRRRRSKF